MIVPDGVTVNISQGEIYHAGDEIADDKARAAGLTVPTPAPAAKAAPAAAAPDK